MPAMRCTAKLLKSLGLVGLLLLFGSTGTGCAGTIAGQVVDAQTGRSIQGAVVLGVWTKGAGLPGLTHTELVGVNEAETDDQGRFTLERPGWYGIEESVTVYKFGYVAWNNLFLFPTSQRRKDTGAPAQIFLGPFPLGESHIRHIDFIDDARAAGFYGLNRIPKFWEALQRERKMQ